VKVSSRDGAGFVIRVVEEERTIGEIGDSTVTKQRA
jgi:hypothetical protein